MAEADPELKRLVDFIAIILVAMPRTMKAEEDIFFGTGCMIAKGDPKLQRVVGFIVVLSCCDAKDDESGGGGDIFGNWSV